MSSRQEEKERRRRERLAAEQEAQAAAARRRRTGFVVGGLLAGVAIAAVVIVVTASGGGGGKPKAKPSAAQVKLESALRAKAAAAGCTAQTFASEGRNHTEAKVDYKANPPTSGNHNPSPASDGIYDRGGTPTIGKLLHALEHTRIEYQYQPGTSRAVVVALQQLMTEPVTIRGARVSPGFLQLLFENTTGMPSAVAATAWTHSITCPAFKGKATLDAFRAFRQAYILNGPEPVPSPE